MNPALEGTLSIWDSQLESYGSKIIDRRKQFVDQLNEIIYEIHKKLTGGKEEINIIKNLIAPYKNENGQVIFE